MNTPPVDAEPFAPGIWVPIVTPFSGEEIDYAATARLIRSLVSTGVHGLVVCGTTGEGPALTSDEKAQLLDTAFATAPTDFPIMLALEGANTAKIIAEMGEIGRWPVNGYLLPAPSYVRPSEDGLRRHFLTVAEAAGAPIMIYDIPARTGSNLSTALIAELAASGRCPAIKACGFSLGRLDELLAISGLSVYCGDDGSIHTALTRGARGVVSASANVFGKALVAHYDACRLNSATEAEAIWQYLLPATQLLFEEPNPAPVKCALALQGTIEDSLRLPMTPCSSALRYRLRAMLAGEVSPTDAEAFT